MTHPHSKYTLLRSGTVYLIICLVLICSSPQAEAGQILERIRSTGTLRVGINPEFWPFSYVNSKGRQGVDIEIARLLAESLRVTLKMVPPKRFKDLIDMAPFSLPLRHISPFILIYESFLFHRTAKASYILPDTLELSHYEYKIYYHWTNIEGRHLSSCFALNKNWALVSSNRGCITHYTELNKTGTNH